MTVKLIEDRPVRRLILEHTCDPDSGGGSTYRSGLYYPEDRNSRMAWQGNPNAKRCDRCGEILPRTVSEINWEEVRRA